MLSQLINNDKNPWHAINNQCRLIWLAYIINEFTTRNILLGHGDDIKWHICVQIVHVQVCANSTCMYLIMRCTFST